MVAVDFDVFNNFVEATGRFVLTPPILIWLSVVKNFVCAVRFGLNSAHIAHVQERSEGLKSATVV